MCDFERIVLFFVEANVRLDEFWFCVKACSESLRMDDGRFDDAEEDVTRSINPQQKEDASKTVSFQNMVKLRRSVEMVVQNFVHTFRITLRIN